MELGMDVSVIIVNYNTKELTKNCIESVIAKTIGVSYEIILVDNASTDGSVEEFQDIKNVRLIRSDVNLGFGKANNLGYRYAHGKYLFLLNSDTILLNNAIKEFYDQMEQRNDSVGCMGCLLVDSEKRRCHSYGRFPTIGNELVRRPFPFLQRIPCVNTGFDVPLRKNEDSSFEVEYIIGADLFLRRKVVDDFGLFDPSFFLYYEETEMQFRYRKNGIVSIIINTPQIMHLEGGSQKERVNLLWRTHDIDSLMLCFRKIYGNNITVFFKFVLGASYLLLALFNYSTPFSGKFQVVKKIFLS